MRFKTETLVIRFDVAWILRGQIYLKGIVKDCSVRAGKKLQKPALAGFPFMKSTNRKAAFKWNMYS